MAETKVGIIIEAEDKASGVISDVQTRLGGLQKGLSNFQPLFKTMAVAGTAAFGAISAGIYSSIQSANEAAKVQAQLGAVLKSTAGVAGVTKEKALELSRALQDETTFNDEAVLSAENLLLTFTNIKDNIFPEATKTVLDMSIALGQDTKSSAIQLGKALQDPILGVTALRRVGINFNDEQKELIKTLVESGRTLDAQRLILKELTTEFGGSATAAAQTFGGRMEQLRNKVDDMKESIGNAFIPILMKLAESLIPVIDKVTKWVEVHPELTKQILIVGGVVSGLTAAIGILGLALPSLIGGIKGVALALNFLVGHPAILAVMAVTAAVVALTSALKKLKEEQLDKKISAAQESVGSVSSIVNNQSLSKEERVNQLRAEAEKTAGVAGLGIPAKRGNETTQSGSQFNFTFNGDVNDIGKLKDTIIGALNRESTLFFAAGK